MHQPTSTSAGVGSDKIISVVQNTGINLGYIKSHAIVLKNPSCFITLFKHWNFGPYGPLLAKIRSMFGNAGVRNGSFSHQDICIIQI